MLRISTKAPIFAKHLLSAVLSLVNSQLKNKIMTLPQLIKAGDKRVSLGILASPPKVDCRVIAEDNFQEIATILKDIRVLDIQGYFNGQKLLSQETRIKIHNFLTALENEQDTKINP